MRSELPIGKAEPLRPVSGEQGFIEFVAYDKLRAKNALLKAALQEIIIAYDEGTLDDIARAITNARGIK